MMTAQTLLMISYALIANMLLSLFIMYRPFTRFVNKLDTLSYVPQCITNVVEAIIIVIW